MTNLPSTLLAALLSYLSHSERFKSAVLVSPRWRDAARLSHSWSSAPLVIRRRDALVSLAAAKLQPPLLHAHVGGPEGDMWTIHRHSLAEHVSALLSFSNLLVLELSVLMFGQLGDLSLYFPRLSELTLWVHLEDPSVASVQRLGKLQQLRSLTVTSRRAGVCGGLRNAEAAIALAALPLLTRLDAQPLVTDDTLKAFADEGTPLRALALPEQITDAGAAALSQLSQLRDLSCVPRDWKEMPQLAASVTRCV